MNYDLDTDEGMKNAIEWTTNLFENMSEGGRWLVPRSETLVCVYPKHKTAEIYEGTAPDPSIARVIKAMGWNVYHIKDAHL